MSLGSEAGLEGTAAMEAIVWAIPRLYHRLSGAAEPLYRQHGLTAGKRSLLADLARQGPHTIAEMVRQRPPVTRQYIQRLVAELAGAGLVTLSTDARDRRAKTVRLTDAGRRLLDALVHSERALIAQLAAGHAPAELDAARNVLSGILTRLEEGAPGDDLATAQVRPSACAEIDK